jgi:hypothetical protein
MRADGKGDPPEVLGEFYFKAYDLFAKLKNDNNPIDLDTFGEIYLVK